ncbi:Flp family type IVb pilin [Nocardioides sp. NPDC127514]|jgi:pilus assembly protein Flp/PilA|uniref:Flp family type IVb pilin n=1 Tax=unclassified Nocardioides TaxID=2615069 RepID=UPI001359C3F0
MLSLFTQFSAWIHARTSSDRDRGATAVEYGLLVGLIAVAIVATLLLLGPRLNALFVTVLNALPGGAAA